MDNIDITPLIQAVIAVIAAVLTSFVIPWIKKKYGIAKWHEIECWVKTAVNAAEQIYIGAGRGAEKKEYVLNFLSEKGYEVDEDKIDAMIESAVYELNNPKE